MLRNFPKPDTPYAHRMRDYFIATLTFLCVAISLNLDATGSLAQQNFMGLIAWTFLFGLLIGENKEVRMQVIIAVAFATAGEHFASIYMQGYTYRFGNVPAYVPPGHGMVYLTAVALARSGLFLRHSRKIAAFVVLTCGLWSLWGISGYPEQGDQVGALLFCVFLIYLFKGRSPMVYLAAFFITTWLELIGTAVGTWKWATIEPVLSLSQGNPPSGVAAWYCLVDAVAIGGAPVLLRVFTKSGEWIRGTKPESIRQQARND
ncbi:hypothetical protein [Nitrosospira multiformis]|uniref:Uncharacterized protein n=1 Tax=Nitrosospira multiformis (strain ATCC 25196 / NCIMB 11849 / C 71) TaxID=323848 RepID=Q2Y5M6_NITMU|nr:hypothetical protein [Nitrosospira multiformis]ABB75945.1 conserved hypothetical protein [Nitrosospira multiformis ATCC 25196]SEA18673.1 hypothetical protein SAMN05216411_105207 [Nitrosospira multiformis]SEG18752.1 hypothetical protein SAMN05216403_1452 [Nitrosospira multiformis ATCC 25196]